MKSFVSVFNTVILFVSFSASAAEKTILHVPFFVEVTSGSQNSPQYTYVPMAELNKKLIKKGQPAQLESIDLDVDSEFDAYENREKVEAAIAAAGIQRTQTAMESVPAQYGNKKTFTCYRGNPEEVLDIVLSQASNLYSEQFSLIAWRYGTNTVLGEYVQGEENPEEFLNSESKEWKNYDVTSDTVLILAAVGDDGTDVNESLIPRCK